MTLERTAANIMVRDRAMVSGDGARRLVDAALDHATATGVAVSVAVVDGSGVLQAFGRVDDAPMKSGEVAQDKAYTAGGTGRATHEWAELMVDNDQLKAAAPAGIRRFVALAGGLVLRADGQVAGGIGVSGGTGEQDQAVAQAALDAVWPNPMQA